MTFPFPLRPLLVLSTVFYINFLARTVFAPLLPVIKIEFSLGHGEAGSLFLFVASGQCVGFLASGFVSSRLNHRLTVLLSVTAVGGVMLAMSQSLSVSRMYAWLFLVGAFEGLYFPSGIAILMELTSRQHWGKAMAIHELAPNLALVSAPLLVEALLIFAPWRGIVAILGVSALLMGVLFSMVGQGGRQKGTSPNPKAMRDILGDPSFWLIAAVLAFALGAADGLYAMLPLFLVHEVRFDRELANTIVGLSHLSGVIIIFSSGVITDRIGAKRATAVFSLAAGISTLMLGILHGSFITPTLVFLQAASIACLFPPVLVIASVNSPADLRNLTLSLLLIVSILFGGGAIPPAIGYLAEAVSFSFAICFLGVLVLMVLPLLVCLRAEFPIHEGK